MIKTKWYGLALGLALLGAAQAEDTMNKQHAMKNGMPGMSSQTDGGMKMSPAMMDKMLRKKQEYILKMHALSNKILAETDPEKKQQLKDEQLQLMKIHHQKKHQMHKMMMQKMRNMK